MNQPVPMLIFINISAHNETYLCQLYPAVSYSEFNELHSLPKALCQALIWSADTLLSYDTKGIKKAVLHGNEGPPLL